MAYRGDERPPLLPPSLECRLRGWLWQGLGILLLAACAVLSACLLTWSYADPSLSRVTSAPARNLLGPTGALLSDLLMQMLGLAGVFVLLPPLFWALLLLTSKAPSGLRGKLLLAPLAVLFLAGALSALPKAPVWPLQHGYGGVLGDLGLGLFTGLLAHFNPVRSAAAAGLFCFAAGLMTLMWSLGLTQRDLRLICRADTRRNLAGVRRNMDTVAGWLWGLQAQARAVRRPAAPDGPDSAPTREPPVFLAKPALPEEASASEIDDDRSEMADQVPDSGRGAAFDISTDRLTRTIAERFAPGGGEKAAAETERREPELPLPAASDA